MTTEPELEILPEEEIEYPPFPDWADEDEQRRAFAVMHASGLELDDFSFFERCQRIVAYLKDGVVPGKPKLVK